MFSQYCGIYLRIKITQEIDCKNILIYTNIYNDKVIINIGFQRAHNTDFFYYTARFIILT